MTDFFYDIPNTLFEWIRWDWLWAVAFWIFVAAVVFFLLKLADYWVSSWQTARWYQRTYNPGKPND